MPNDTDDFLPTRRSLLTA